MVEDGFGRRSIGIDSETGDQVELLDLTTDLVENAGFVTALGERVARFAAVRHTSYVHLRRIDRPSADRLQLVSDLTPGWRLSELLDASTAAAIPVDITVVIGLLRQLLPALALYGRHNRDAAIGALGVERLIVTPQARLVIAEHAFGPALEKLNLGREQLWRDLRVASPPSTGAVRVTQRADAHGAGVVALALLLGRPLTLSEYPDQLSRLVDGLSERRDGQSSPLSTSFNGWLQRALQFDVRTAFQSPSETQLAFESVLASDRSYVTSSAKLEEWVTTIGGQIDAERRPADLDSPPVEPEAPVVVATPVEAETVAEPAPADVDSHDLPTPPPAASKRPMMALAGVVVLLLATVAWLWSRDGGGPRAGEGELVVQSRPIGARVSVDGSERGVTPLTVRLPSGAHVLEVQIGKAEPRVIPLTIQANVQTAQYVELQGATVTGSLEIRSEPSGARIIVDGQPRGTTPATIRDLAAGEHAIVLEVGTRKVSQSVKIEAGGTAQLVVPIPRR
jgi:hypothetical protein